MQFSAYARRWGCRHILLNGRRVGKIIWDAAEEQWEIHATPDGVRLRRCLYDAEPDDPVRIDRVASADVAYELANDVQPLSDEVR